jgi:hypothetical protein
MCSEMALKPGLCTSEIEYQETAIIVKTIKKKSNISKAKTEINLTEVHLRDQRSELFHVNTYFH